MAGPDKALYLQVLIAAAGNFLEWYDFAVYGIFASEISTAFFPSNGNTTANLLKTFGIFAGAFLVRPLGGILFGHVGDIYGREVALLLTIMLMATPTLAIGLLPTYDDIGVAAPCLLALMRLLQGMAAGGELPGALIYAVESAGPRHRGLLGALCQATGVGSLLASAVAALLHAILGDAAVRRWGWRIPFFLGAALALLTCVARRNFKPTPAFLEAKAKRARESAASNPATAAVVAAVVDGGGSKAWLRRRLTSVRSSPLCVTLRTSWRSVLRIMLASPLGMVGFYALFIFIPAWLRSTRLVDNAFALNVGATLLWAVCVVSGGAIADRTTPKRLAIRRGGHRHGLLMHGLAYCSMLGALAVAALAPVLFYLLRCDDVWHAEHGIGQGGTDDRLGVSNDTAEKASSAAGSDAPTCVGASPPSVFVPLLLLVVCLHGLHVGPLQAFYVLSLKEASNRYSALGVAYNLGAAALGGTTPLIATSLAASDLGVLGAGAYLSLAALVTTTTIILSESFAPLLGPTSVLLPAGTVRSGAVAAGQGVELPRSRAPASARPPHGPPWPAGATV